MRSLMLFIVSVLVTSSATASAVDLAELHDYETASCIHTDKPQDQIWAVNVYTKNRSGYAVISRAAKVIAIVEVTVARESSETFGVVEGKDFSLSIDLEDYSLGRMKYKNDSVVFGDVAKMECSNFPTSWEM